MPRSLKKYQNASTEEYTSFNVDNVNENISYRRFDRNARLVIIFGVGFLLGIIAMVIFNSYMK